jgi:predicted transposase YdaD
LVRFPPLLPGAPEQPDMVGTIIGLGYTGLEESVATALLGALKMTNALEELIAEGIVQGQQEGLAAGWQQGQVEGKRAALRIMLTLRFGTVPGALDARIAAATGEALDTLIAQAVRAETIDDL